MKKKSLLNCRWFHILFPVYAVFSLLYLISGQLHLDEGAYLYASRAVYQGAVPYRDFFFLQPPLFPYIYGFIQLIFSGLLYARLTSILFGFLTILILMKFVQRLSDREGSYVFLALITMTPFQLYFFSISRLYSLTAFFLSAGVLLIFEKQQPNYRRAVFGLCALALGLGTRLTILPFFLLACGYVLVKARDAKSKVLPPVIAVLMLAAVYLPFILLTGLDRFWFNIAGMNLSLHANDIHAAFAQKLRATFQLFRFYFPVWILLIPLMLRFAASIRNISFKNLFSAVTGHLAVLWIGVLGMLVVHSSARIYQVSYQTIIMPLLCVLVAIEWRKMYLQADRQSRLLFRSCFAALWIVGIVAYGRTSISIINGKPALMALHEQAAFIARHTQPHDKVFSADSPLAVTESGRDVLRGMAGSDLFPDWSTEKCLEYNVLNFDIMTDHVQNQEGALLIMGDKSFKKSLPHLENIPEETRNAFLGVIDEFYETIGVFPNLLLPDTFSYYKAPRVLRNSPPGKLLVFGIDAMGWDVLLPLIESGELPNMQRLFRTGGKANMKTLSPTVSVMLWTTMATGVFPERHGIDNWLAESLDSSGQQAITSDRRKVHAFWNVSGTKKVCVVNWWATWPVEPVNGIMISNRAHYPDMSYTVFPDTAETLLHNTPRVDKKTLENELHELNPYQTPIVLPEFFSQLLQKDRFYLDIAKQCLVTFSDIDIMAVFVRGVDILEHEYLRDVRHDATGIPEIPPEQRGIVRSYYRYLDRWLGDFLEIMGPETGVIIVSDHGMDPVETLPPLIEGLNLGKLLDTLSQFSEKPLLYRNFADNKRYPLGLKRGIAWTGDTPVLPDDVTQLAHELHQLKLENGQHFFTDVAIGENPDEVITLTINPFPNFQSVITWRGHEIPVMSVTGMIIHPRSGQHWNSPDGVFMISGPGVQQSKEMRDIHIYEIMPSFLAWLGLPVSRDLDGKPQMKFFTPDFDKMHPVSWVDSYGTFERIKPVSVPSSIDQELRRELESLGYIHTN
jgi:predicted AlkP superfamily phosphohydrolase/phosphomutase